MLKDGDRVLVCLSGTSSSLCLLHALRQFSRARGIQIELGAVSLGSSGVDPRALMLYLRDLNVKYMFEHISKALQSTYVTPLVPYSLSMCCRSCRQCPGQTADCCPTARLHSPCTWKHVRQTSWRLPGLGAQQRTSDRYQGALRQSGRWSAHDPSIHLRARTSAGGFCHSTWDAHKTVQTFHEAARRLEQHPSSAGVDQSERVWQYQMCASAATLSAVRRKPTNCILSFIVLI